MKNIIFDFLKGFLIGLDSTIPGFSIGTLAIFLNIYERLIEDFSTILKHPFKIIKKDLFLGLGFIVGLIANILIVTWLLSKFPIQTVSFFVGLIMVAIPQTFKKMGKSNIRIGEIIAFILSIAVLVGVTLLNAGTTKEMALKPEFMIMITIMGVIGAGTMIIPGVSGAMIIMAFGYYDSIMGMMRSLLHSLRTFDFTGFGTTLICVLLFLIGCVLGVVLISKLIKMLLDKFPSKVYASILGLLVASPFAIYYITSNDYEIDYANPWVYIISAVTLALGVVFGIVTSKADEKKEE